MHNKPNILVNHLYPSGTRFTVTPDVKGNLFTPSSIGFVSYMVETDFDYQNVAIVRVIVTRKGKGGQNRINVSDMSVPIFTSDDMLKHENYLPIERRAYSHIESIPFDEASLLNISSLDFLGWACAYATYLQYLAIHMSYPRGVSAGLWPDGSDNNVLKDVYMLSQRFEENPKLYLEEYGTEVYRMAFVSKARELESALIKCATSYKKGVIDAILNSAYFLKYTNEEYYKVVDEKLVKNTIEFYEKSRYQIKSMIKKPNKNKSKKRTNAPVTRKLAEPEPDGEARQAATRGYAESPPGPARAEAEPADEAIQAVGTYAGSGKYIEKYAERDR